MICGIAYDFLGFFAGVGTSVNWICFVSLSIWKLGADFLCVGGMHVSFKMI